MPERLLVFDRDFLEDLAHWVSTDRKVALKVLAWMIHEHRHETAQRLVAARRALF
jgi:Txe/YoeB family toxin of Txe-Axe toxin-antitoxin module